MSFIEVFSTGSNNDQGWDTHKTGFKDTPHLCEEVDPGYATLLRDLEDRGMLEDTLVVWMGEFGRTPKIKKDGGRDHYAKGWITCLAGGGVKAGQVIGRRTRTGSMFLTGRSACRTCSSRSAKYSAWIPQRVLHAAGPTVASGQRR